MNGTIKLGGDYSLMHDKYQWVLTRHREYEGKEGELREAEDALGYYATLKQALGAYLEAEAKTSTAKDAKRLIEVFEQLQEDLVAGVLVTQAQGEQA